jgi:prophage regulatory protein
LSSRKHSMAPLPITGHAPVSASLRLLSFNELRTLKGVPYSRTEIRRKERAGAFPKHVRLGDGIGACIAWVEGEIDAWLTERMKARENQ